MKRLSSALLCCLACFAGHRSYANDIQVTNAALTNNDLVTGTCFVQFDVTWQNSWRQNGVVNWDAAWVFVKFRTINDIWQHVNINPSGHVAPAGSRIDIGLEFQEAAFNAATNPVMGVFIRRSTAGSGTFSASGTQLLWSYADQGLAFNDIVEVRVFAIEMVHVNGGAFAAGSGGTETNAFSLTTINTDNASATPIGGGSLGGQAGGSPLNAFQAINPFFPNGFLAFYCMKYELSQQQYVEFLNTLTRTQQDARTGTSLPIGVSSITNRFVMSNTATIQNRNGIACDATVSTSSSITFHCDGNANGIGGEATDGLWRACNFLSFGDLMAYLDWSGLRPMSEMEFEKACRGPMLPLANEFAWSTTTLTGLNYSLTNSGAINENIGAQYNLLSGNAAYASTTGSIQGPVRTGIFAANVNNDGRISSGAGYYGIMELSGNVSEPTIEIVNGGDAFSRSGHGDGSLNATGNGSGTGWPNSNPVFGVILRGGAWSGSSTTLRVSDRSNLNVNGLQNRLSNVGGRGARFAP